MIKPDTSEELLTLIFSQKGLLGRSLKGFQERKGQKEMASHVLEAYEKERFALVEAGTGIGKTLAYLVPAFFWALKHQEKTVISTNTISLQEQLIHKDIPFLLQTLDVELKAVLVKGMGNYVCLRKVDEMRQQPLLIASGEEKELQSIENWLEKTEEGSRSSLSSPISSSAWEKISAERLSCNHVHCSFYKKCHFFKARKEAEDAQILVVNHHLLLADVQRRRKGDQKESIIPSYSRLIIDESHHLQDVALESFAERIDKFNLVRLLSRLSSETHPETSRLFLLRKELLSSSAVSPALQQKLEISLPAQKRECVATIESTFETIFSFMEKVATREEGESKLRITPSLATHPEWNGTVIPALTGLKEQMVRFTVSLDELIEDFKIFQETSLYEKLAPHLVEIESLIGRFEEIGAALEQFSTEETTEKRVRWLERNGGNLALIDAALNISELLKEELFSPTRTSILCSATMTTSNSFAFFKQRLGLEDSSKDVTENCYASPFDYKHRCLFAVPTDLPLPLDPAFLPKCIKVIEEAISISRGSAFILFTSYEMLQSTYRALSNTPLGKKYPFLKQGDLPRHLLLEQFKQREGSVLFATDSFWEGVDVPGEALRCVIIAKLPFSVPTDPLYQAYSESLKEEGKDPFMDYSVPQAVIKFKQGFGRLMRQKNDRGCVLCLDNRIVKKNYGKFFVESLPECATSFGSQEVVFEEMRSFYKRTAF